MIKKLLKFLIPLIVLGGIFLVFLYLISPVNEEVSIKTDKIFKFEDYIKEKKPDSIEYDIKNKQVFVGYFIKEKDLSDMILSACKNSSLEKHADYLNITGSTVEVKDNYLKLYIGVKLLNKIQSQIILEFEPEKSDVGIKLKLVKASIGRIPISNNYVINMLERLQSESVEVDTTNSTIEFMIDKSDLFKIKSISFEEDRLNMKITVSFNSIGSLIMNNAKDILK